MTSKPLIAATGEPLTAQAVAAAPVEQVLRWLDSSADGLSSARACERLAHDGALTKRIGPDSKLYVMQALSGG